MGVWRWVLILWKSCSEPNFGRLESCKMITSLLIDKNNVYLAYKFLPSLAFLYILIDLINHILRVN